MTLGYSLFALAAFLSGSIPWSYILGRIRGTDIREHGSGNVGATNLFRTCGKGIGLTGLLLDALKGAIPVLAARTGLLGAVEPLDQWGVSAVAIAAVLGHVFSPWLGFRGGKGVATTLGVLVMIAPLTLLAGLVVFVIVLAVTRYVSLGSIFAALAVIPAVFIFQPASGSYRIIVFLVAALILFRHKSNMVKLLRGEENKFSLGGKHDG